MSNTKTSYEWSLVDELNDYQAVIAGLEVKRQQIELKSLYELSYDDIHELACDMMPELRKLKLTLKRVCDIATEIAQQRKETKNV
jgi:hypothetical protein